MICSDLAGYCPACGKPDAVDGLRVYAGTVEYHIDYGGQVAFPAFHVDVAVREAASPEVEGGTCTPSVCKLFEKGDIPPVVGVWV